MALNNLTDRTAVVRAIAEYDRLGAEAFLKKYGFKPARSYHLLHEGRRYDSKAIAGVAHGYQHPSAGHLPASDFSGGELTVARQLRQLGFEITRASSTPRPAPALVIDQSYSWSEVGELFEFKPSYLSAAGGMIPRPDHGALLLITHPKGGRSFDYEDYWDGPDLIYTGRGKVGDQPLTGPNADVANNRRILHVFENVGSKLLRYLGEALCADTWPTRGIGDDGKDRLIHRFRLQFKNRAARPVVVSVAGRPSSAVPFERKARPFNPEQSATPFKLTGRRTAPEEVLALQEKSTRAHRAILAALSSCLAEAGWDHIEEIPAGIDLWAKRQDGRRVIFEAKSIAVNEVSHCRSALAQLLEYRFFYGSADDEICLVVDNPVGDARVRFMEGLGVGVLLVADGRLKPIGLAASRLLTGYAYEAAPVKKSKKKR